MHRRRMRWANSSTTASSSSSLLCGGKREGGVGGGRSAAKRGAEWRVRGAGLDSSAHHYIHANRICTVAVKSTHNEQRERERRRPKDGQRPNMRCSSPRHPGPVGHHARHHRTQGDCSGRPPLPGRARVRGRRSCGQRVEVERDGGREALLERVQGRRIRVRRRRLGQSLVNVVTKDRKRRDRGRQLRNEAGVLKQRQPLHSLTLRSQVRRHNLVRIRRPRG